jgi:hypothetical protein
MIVNVFMVLFNCSFKFIFIVCVFKFIFIVCVFKFINKKKTNLFLSLSRVKIV